MYNKFFGIFLSPHTLTATLHKTGLRPILYIKQPHPYIIQVHDRKNKTRWGGQQQTCPSKRKIQLSRYAGVAREQLNGQTA
jgi:hypothetical protein